MSVSPRQQVAASRGARAGAAREMLSPKLHRTSCDAAWGTKSRRWEEHKRLGCGRWHQLNPLNLTVFLFSEYNQEIPASQAKNRLRCAQPASSLFLHDVWWWRNSQAFTQEHPADRWVALSALLVLSEADVFVFLFTSMSFGSAFQSLWSPQWFMTKAPLQSCSLLQKTIQLLEVGLGVFKMTVWCKI